MKTFRIYHPVAGMNHQCLRGIYEYSKVCQVEAADLNEAFIKGQNDFSDDYALLNKRSTSVGDIIVNVQEDKHYMIVNLGFVEVPSTVTQWFDWSNDDEDEDYEESDDDYQDRLERSWEKYEDQIPVKEDQSKWLTLDEVVSASLPDEIVVDEDGEIASFDYYTGIKVAKKRGLVQTTDFQEVRQGTHFIVTWGDVLFSVTSDEYKQVARRSLI